MMYVLYSIISFGVAYLWLSYLREVDVFQTDNWKRILTSFFIGCLSVIPVFALSFWVGEMFEMTNKISDIFLFMIFDVGLIEEASKLLLAIVVLRFFVISQEPVDYIIHAAAVGTGFAAVENVLYIGEFDIDVLRGRAPMSVFIHMSLTSVPVYFYAIFNHSHPKGLHKYFAAMAGLVLAAVIHGLFNSFFSISGGFLLSFVVYFVMVEVWLTQTNNLLNISPHFNKQIVPDFTIQKRKLFVGFALLAIVEIVFLHILHNKSIDLFSFVWRYLILVVLPISTIMSKFSNLRLIPGKRFPLFFQFTSTFKIKPFQTNRNGAAGFSSALHDLRIDSPVEQQISGWLHSKVRLKERGVKSGLPVSVAGVLTDKYWINEDEVFFGFEPLSAYTIDGFRSDLWLLKARTVGETKFEGFPEIMVFLIPSGTEITRTSKLGDFVPRARCYMEKLID